MSIDKEEVFEFLDDLRESGVTNMFGATSYIVDEYPSLSRKEAGVLLQDWMQTFAARQEMKKLTERAK